jgi:hypothetical protein
LDERELTVKPTWIGSVLLFIKGGDRFVKTKRHKRCLSINAVSNDLIDINKRKEKFMKTKMLITVFLAICLVLAFAVPASAAKPITQTYNDEIILAETIMVGGVAVPILVHGSGTITNHVVKTPASSEESWFEISSFSGYMFIGPYGPQFMGLADVKVTFHSGNGRGQQPLITIRSSTPIVIPEPFATMFGLHDTYTKIQMVGGKIIYAK